MLLKPGPGLKLALNLKLALRRRRYADVHHLADLHHLRRRHHLLLAALIGRPVGCFGVAVCADEPGQVVSAVGGVEEVE